MRKAKPEDSDPTDATVYRRSCDPTRTEIQDFDEEDLEGNVEDDKDEGQRSGAMEVGGDNGDGEEGHIGSNSDVDNQETHKGCPAQLLDGTPRFFCSDVD
jgi:hypothetical protein